MYQLFNEQVLMERAVNRSLGGERDGLWTGKFGKPDEYPGGVLWLQRGIYPWKLGITVLKGKVSEVGDRDFYQQGYLCRKGKGYPEPEPVYLCGE